MQDDHYTKVLTQNLVLAKGKLQALKEDVERTKKEYGEKHWRYIIALEKVSIASENIIDQEYFLEHGVNRCFVQSIALPKEIADKLHL